VRVADIKNWTAVQQEKQIKTMIQSIGLMDAEAERAEENMKLLRQVMRENGLVPAEIIDEDAPDADSAKNIDDILEIFVRVNQGGTKLTRSDLMFSLLKSRWSAARMSFDEVLTELRKKGHVDIDKDFIIRGLLTVVGRRPRMRSITSRATGKRCVPDSRPSRTRCVRRSTSVKARTWGSTRHRFSIHWRLSFRSCTICTTSRRLCSRPQRKPL